MTKRVFLAVLLVLTLALGLTGVVCAEPLENLVMWETAGTRELENFLMIKSESLSDHNVLCNAYSTLLEINNKGRLRPAIAKEWGTNDNGLTWTFKLRDDVMWVDVNANDKAKCTAWDWITALEWTMNYHKNGASHTSQFIDMLKGAEEYYNYTKGLERDEALKLTKDSEKFRELVGVEAPDDYTLVYHCKKNAPYFDTLCVAACFYPICQAEIDEKGVENMLGINNTNMWYNGAYLITEYIHNNRKELTANPKYWDKDAKRFKTVTILMISDATTDDQLFETGEVDQCELNEANLRRIWEDKDNPMRKYLVEKRPRQFSFQFHLNFAKNNKDGTPDVNWNTAAANENFRKSLFYGLNLVPYWSRTNFIYPLHCENLSYAISGLLYFSDGSDYVDHVIAGLGLPESNGEVSRRYNPELAAEYKAKAIEELKAKGVTFPIQLDYYIKAGSQTTLDSAIVMKEIFEALGPEYIQLNICTYVSSLSQEVVLPRLQSLVINGWGTDYGDPENLIGQELYGVDKAYYSNRYSHINDVDPEKEPELIAAYKEFTELAAKASNIFDNMDERYNAYVEAEVCMLKHAVVIPAYVEVTWQMTKINDYSKMNAMFGGQNYTYKNWETSTEPYTAEDYAKFRADFEASK